MKHLYVAALGDVEQEAAAAIRAVVAREFGVAVRELELPDPEFALDRERGQYASIAVLRMLAEQRPADALKLLAVTEHDLFVPVLTFVFGHAQLGGRVAVVSLARLRQEFYGLATNREVLLHRASKEALHETGHTFGLVHCPDKGCAMALSTNVRQVDSKRAALCPACTSALGRARGAEGVKR